jgi:hypothetical protein
MTFLNPLLVFGVAACTIPLIIHLLNRSRFRTVDWAAMHLLESVISSNRRRVRFDQWILLLIRCAIPAVLALCMARPVLTGAGLLAGDAPVSLVILLDNSYSMEVADPAGTRFQAAVEAACQIIGAGSRGSEYAVIQMGGSPTPVFDRPVFDAGTMIQRLRQLQPGYGACDVPASLDQAIALLKGMSNARRELLVISDFQPADWQLLQSEGAAALKQRLAGLNVPPELTLLPITPPDTAADRETQPANIAIESLELPRHAIGAGQQISLRASIRNYGIAEIPSARILLKHNDQEVAVVQTALQPSGITQVLFPYEFEQPGSQVLSVDVVSADPLPTDNQLSASVNVWKSLQVVLVDGAPGSLPLQSETDYLSIALTPLTFGRMELKDLILTTTVPPAGLNDELLKTARTVVLANVPQLADPQLVSLTQFVQRGGTLLICAGNRMDLNWHREKLFANGLGLLPAAWGELRGANAVPAGAATATPPAADTEPPARIVSRRFDHPALQFFNEPASGDLSSASIRQWYAVVTTPPPSDSGSDNRTTDLQNSQQTPAQSAAPEPSPIESATPPEVAGEDDSDLPTVMAQLDNGSPLLLQKRVGDGVVVQLTTACDADWSDLPLRPFYVPLMQQLLTSMAEQVMPPRNIRTGEPAVALFAAPETSAVSSPAAPANAAPPTPPGTASSPATAPPPAAASPLSAPVESLTTTVMTPDGGRRSVPVTSRDLLYESRFQSTQRPGLYTMTLPAGDVEHFVAGTSRQESDLQLLSQTQCRELAAGLSATLVPTARQYLDQDAVRRYGQEIWKYFLAGLLVLLLLEMVLQQRFAGVRS